MSCIAVSVSSRSASGSTCRNVRPPASTVLTPSVVSRRYGVSSGPVGRRSAYSKSGMPPAYSRGEEPLRAPFVRCATPPSANLSVNVIRLTIRRMTISLDRPGTRDTLIDDGLLEDELIENEFVGSEFIGNEFI